ncbi:MAG TPA: hypothetical protein VFS76_18885 [Pyrinomonadaceae bacterium]|nr:hypothetical protein [Pyrinomonadaceae bacterium]
MIAALVAAQLRKSNDVEVDVAKGGLLELSVSQRIRFDDFVIVYVYG